MAARQKGSFSLGGTLEILADAPADARLCVKTKSELTDANSYPYKYIGMIVSVADEGKAYILTAADTTIASNWKELGEGGGGGGGTAGSVYTGTLLASGWNSTTKQQTLTFTDYSADYHGVIGLPADATAAQMEEYRNCLIRTVSQSGATVTFECEEIPTINLPVEIYCGGGSGSAEFPSGGTTGQALVKKSNADNDVEWGDVGGEAFIVTVTMDGGGNLTADKTPKELEDAIADNAITKAYFPTYGLVLDLNINASGTFAFSTFYIEDQDDVSSSAFATILMVKDTDSAWDSITMQTVQGDKFSKEVKCGADLFDQSTIYLNDFDHEEDTTNEQDIVSPHRLTQTEILEIMAQPPGAPVNDGNPVGTIISFMGINAPYGYLKCDGSVVNIADYQRLANHIGSQFGSINYFGGDGTTTFATPDLRGEFLRGTGTNSHTNQGSGGNVGSHQNATISPYIIGYVNSSQKGMVTMNLLNDTAQTSNVPGNMDSTYLTRDERYFIEASYSNIPHLTGSDTTFQYTSRPTNTSVLYCIKY